MPESAWQRLRGWFVRKGEDSSEPERFQRVLRAALSAGLHGQVQVLALEALEAAPRGLPLGPVVELLQRSLDATGQGRAWAVCALYLRASPGVARSVLVPQDRARLAWLLRSFERAGEGFTQADWHAHAALAYGHGGLHRRALASWQALAAGDRVWTEAYPTGLVAFHAARSHLALRDLAGAHRAWGRAREALAQALLEARFHQENDRAWDLATLLAALEGDAGCRKPWYDARCAALAMLEDDGMREEHLRESLALAWDLARTGATGADLVPHLEGALRAAFRRGDPARWGLLAAETWAVEERRAERQRDPVRREEAQRVRAAVAGMTLTTPTAVPLPTYTLTVPPYVTEVLALDLGDDLAETAAELLLLGPGVATTEARSAALALAVDAWTSEQTPSALVRWVGRVGAVGAYELLAPLTALASHPEASVRRAVAEVAGAFRFRRTVDLLERCAADPDETVRRAALGSLGGLGVEAAVARLDRLRANATDPELRRAALWALGSVGTASAVTRLVDVLARGDAGDAQLAAELLVRSAVPETEALLGAGRDRHGDPEGRLAAVASARLNATATATEQPSGGRT